MSEPALPFAVAEYRERAAAVRRRMAERGVDVLFVMSPANLCYLTGFESVWYPPRAPLGAVVSQADDRLVFLDYDRHETLVRATAHFDDAVFFDYSTALDTIVDAFRANGWTGGTVGIERWTPTPGAPLVAETADRLAAAGAAIVDGDWIVDRVRLVKSPAEMERVRRAGEIVDTAFESLAEFVRPGRTELEIAAHLNSVMAGLGGGESAVPTMVSAGPDVWCRTHSRPTARPVQTGDVMYVDACGVVDRYHADVCRTFAIGRDHPEARAVLEYTSGSVGEVQRAVHAGDPLNVAQKAAEEYVFSRYPRDRVWWVGGYALGIALPPSWVGHTYLSGDAFEDFTWEPGYVTNYENIVFGLYQSGGSPVAPRTGYTASYMETLLMTDTGIEVLSKLPRTLTVLGGS